MKLPPPMKTNRVQEALAAVGEYVAFAEDIAANVQPISLVTQNATQVDVLQPPKAENIEVDSSGLIYTVTGNYLKNVKNVSFISIKNIKKIERGTVDSATQTEALVRITLKNSLINTGLHQVWLTDDQGRGDIIIYDSDIPAAPNPQPSNESYSVTAVVPDEFVLHCKNGKIGPDKVFVEVISGGDRFPADIEFEADAANDFIQCGSIISTGNPKVLIVPINIITNKAQTHPPIEVHIKALLGKGVTSQISDIDATINVKSNGHTQPKSTFKLKFLLL